MGGGYSVSASASSGSGTGAVQFGNVTAGSNGVSNTTVMVIVGAVLAAALGFFLLMKK